MTELLFRQDGRQIAAAVQPGDTLLQAVRRAGLTVESPCNGNGTCGKCRVRLQTPDGSFETALACITPATAARTVELPSGVDSAALQIHCSGHLASLQFDGLIQKIYQAEQDKTVVRHRGKLLTEEAGDTTAACFGLLVDIGTTTLVAALIDLSDGRELACRGALNPQSRIAQDVLSRIRHASTATGLAELQQSLIGELNRLITELTGAAGIRHESIYEAVLSGNSCMLHLVAGIDPSPLGVYPYRPSLHGDEYISAAALGLTLNEHALAYLPPLISAYIGGDISSGLLAAKLAAPNGVRLFIDIGTNGEIVLSVNGRLSAASTAAGPAFEGMNISQGMRAAPGAVESFQLQNDGSHLLATIDNQPPVGICGSGLLDIVGQLVQHRLIGKNGRFDAKTATLTTAPSGKTAFAVCDNVWLTQQDVRQVQLAKGAIRSGIEALLAQHSLTADDIDQVLIAGSFGYHLNPDSLLALGLLPAACRGKVEFLGNTSKSGAHALLLSQDYRSQTAHDAATVQVLELATLPDFDRLFVNCLSF